MKYMNKIVLLVVVLVVTASLTAGIIWGLDLLQHTSSILLNYCNINEEMKLLCQELL